MMAGLFRVRKLRKALLGHDPEARADAAEELEELAWEPGDDPERAALLVGKGEWEQAAALGSVAVRFLGEAMEKIHPRSRVKIAGVLGALGDAEAVPHLLATIEEGDGWVSMDGSVLAYEKSRDSVERADALFPGLGAIGGMIEMGGARVEVRGACEDALVAIAKSGVDITAALARAQGSGVSWVRESVSRVLEQVEEE